MFSEDPVLFVLNKLTLPNRSSGIKIKTQVHVVYYLFNHNVSKLFKEEKTASENRQNHRKQTEEYQNCCRNRTKTEKDEQ